MAIPLLSALRCPPTPGRLYMVPVVFYPHLVDRPDYWPVAGPLHEDSDFFNFGHLHYHVDTRFVTARQARIMEGYVLLAWTDYNDALEASAGRFPLSRRVSPFDAAPIAHAKGMPQLAMRRCRAAEREYQFSKYEPVKKLNRHYAGRKHAVAPIRKPDGRLLCPHRKYDLSQHTPDAKGIVVCPLHGLKVRCG